MLIPPVPAAALPYLQAIPDERATLVVTADADRAVALLDACAGARAIAVSGLARAQRQLDAGLPHYLFVSAADALRLLGRSALRAAEFQTVVLAWPEQLDEDGRAALETVMAEIARDSQRMILVAAAGPEAEALVQRYAFKAVTFGFPPNEGSEAPAPTRLGAASFVVARPGQIEAVRRSVLDALDPASDDLVVVAPCPVSREAAEALVAGGAPPAGAARRLVLVVEPSQLAWLRGLFAPLTALRLPSALDALEQRAEALRARIARTIDTRNLDRELFLIGPLLERFDPAEVAAAALQLGHSGAQTAEGVPEPGPRAADDAAVPSWVRLWVGVGKKDNVRPGDVLGAIVGETKLEADRVGKIEVRELYCLVEVRAEDADRVMRALTGTTLRGRRVTARVDRGHAPAATPRAGRPGA